MGCWSTEAGCPIPRPGLSLGLPSLLCSTGHLATPLLWRELELRAGRKDALNTISSFLSLVYNTLDKS